MRVSEFRYWSPVLGCDAVRMSCFDGLGGEFFIIIPADDEGRAFREARQFAAEAIHEAMSLGLQPGEVRYEAIA
jgi:hypothetical protein